MEKDDVLRWRNVVEESWREKPAHVCLPIFLFLSYFPFNYNTVFKKELNVGKNLAYRTVRVREMSGGKIHWKGQERLKLSLNKSDFNLN